MNMILLGNVISLISAILYGLSAMQKETKPLFIFQILGASFLILSCIVLKGYSGVIVVAIDIVRAILILCKKQNKYTTVCLIIAVIIPSLVMHYQTIADWLPVISSVAYSILLKDSNVPIKRVLLANLMTMVLWSSYCLIISNYVSALQEYILMIITLRTLFIIHKQTQFKDIKKKEDDLNGTKNNSL